MPVGGGVRVFVLSIIESFSIVTADTSRISRFLRSIFDLFARAGKGFSVHAFQLKSLLKVEDEFQTSTSTKCVNLSQR